MPTVSDSCVICGAPFPAPLANRRTCNNPQCGLSYSRHLLRGGLVCQECGRPLSAAEESRGPQSCGNRRCQIRSRDRGAVGAEERCRICRVPLSPERVATGLCFARECQAIHSKQQQSEQVRQSLEEWGEQTRLGVIDRDQRAAREDIPDADQYFVTLVQLVDNPLAPLPEERRQKFRQNLEKVVQELSESLAGNPGLLDEPLPPRDDIQPDPPPEEGRFAVAVCTACRGSCCRQGGDHSFLEVNTLRKVLKYRRDLTLDQLADAYVERLPELTFRDSCVFHSETGCTLLPEMRSTICNEFFCNSHHDLRMEVRDGAPRRAYVAITDGEKIVAGHFIDNTTPADSKEAGASGD